jgi:hypothetical protein
MKKNWINLMLRLFVSILFVLAAQNSMAQYQAYETLVNRGNEKYTSGDDNMNAQKYQAAKTDFNDAIRYFESSKKISSKPENAASEMDKKISACRAKISQINRLMKPDVVVVKEEKPVIPELSVSTETVLLSDRKKSETILVNSNIEWVADTLAYEPWFGFEKKDGYVNIFSLAENEAAYPRSLILKVSAGDTTRTILVEQAGIEPYLTADKGELRFTTFQETPLYIATSTNMKEEDWTLDTSNLPDWCTIEKMPDGRIAVLTANNQTEFDRGFTFKIKADNVAQIPVTVEQEGLKFFTEPRELAFTRNGSTQKIDITSTYLNGWSEITWPDWCKIGERTKNTLEISALDNPGEAREGILELRSGGKTQTVKISQQEAEFIATKAEKEVAFPYGGGLHTLFPPQSSNNSALTWTLASAPSWCELRGSEPAKFVFGFTRNPTAVPRRGFIQFTAPYRSYTVEVTQDGKKIPASKYDVIGDFFEDLAIVRANSKYGYVNKSGKEVIPLMYDSVNFFFDGIAIVQSNGKYGYIDKKGRSITPMKYDSAKEFSEGFAVVESGGKFGYVSLKGKEITALQYDSAENFSSGIGYVKLGTQEYCIDQKGVQHDPRSVIKKAIGKK